MPFAEDRASLLAILAQLSFRLGDFTLASGAKSDYYIDCRTTTLDAEGRSPLRHPQWLPCCATWHHRRKRSAASPWAPIPWSQTLQPASAYYRQQHAESPLVHGFLVRKAMKAHGTGRQIEGYVHQGAHTGVVDDVCTTGGSTITAIEAVRAAGMHVAAVLCLVDRQQGGRENIEAAIPGATLRRSVHRS